MGKRFETFELGGLFFIIFGNLALDAIEGKKASVWFSRISFMAHGDTHEMSLNNAKDALRLWIDTALECGDTVPAPKGRRLVYA